MTRLITVKPIGSPKANLLFVGRMKRYDGPEPPGAISYLAPGLLKAGYSVTLSRAVPFTKFGDKPPARTKLNQVSSVLQKEIQKQNINIISSSVYEENVLFILDLARAIHSDYPRLPFSLGGPLITSAPGASMQIFDFLPDLIMVNGAGEYAFPEALDAYMAAQTTSSPGIFVKKHGNILSDNFLTKRSLTEKEHETLEPSLAFFNKEDLEDGLMTMTSSRGCMAGCSFCAASHIFGGKNITWSAPKRIKEIERHISYLKDTGFSFEYKPRVVFYDDDFLYNRQKGLKFLQLFREHPLGSQVEIQLQTRFGSLFDSQGRFMEEIADNMLLPGGEKFVYLLDIGGDFWTESLRRRNKGWIEEGLSNDQIRQAIKEFSRRKIRVRSYWLAGDEQTTLSDFTRAALFLNDLKIDFGRYFSVADPAYVDPHIGTKIRARLQDTEIIEKFNRRRAVLGTGPDSVELLDFVPLPGHLMNFMMVIASKITALENKKRKKEGEKKIKITTPDDFLSFMRGFSRIGRDLPMEGKQVKIMVNGKLQRFLFSEIKELIEVSQQIPEYYDSMELLRAEIARRQGSANQ